MGTERWKPTRGARVRIAPRKRAAPDEPPPPAGVWYVIERGPNPLTWWVQATDLEAKHWASTHPGDVTSGCWLAPAGQLVPINGIRI